VNDINLWLYHNAAARIEQRIIGNSAKRAM